MFSYIIIGICVLALIGMFECAVKFICGVGTTEEKDWGIAFLIAIGLTALSVLIAYLWCM